MLTEGQKDFYAENGYLMVENAVTAEQLATLREITADLIEASRAVRESNEVYDLDRGHGPDSPRLTRIKIPHKLQPYFGDILRNSAMTEVMRDRLGPDTMILMSKLNIKAAGGGGMASGLGLLPTHG